MNGTFKVGDKVKVKSYSEFDFSDDLYEDYQNDVRVIADGVFEILKLNSDGDLCLDTKGRIGFSYFYVHPTEVTPVSTSTKKPRPHAELIKQWADDDSLEVEKFDILNQVWVPCKRPGWYIAGSYRIKPKTVTKWRWAYEGSTGFSCITSDYYTEEEFHREYKDAKNSSKLLWTEKEFQVV